LIDPRWPHRDSRLTDRPHSRHPRRVDVRHGSELDRRATLKEALEKVRAPAGKPKSRVHGSWWPAAGTEEQFAAEAAADPRAKSPRPRRDHPVYIQHLYDWLLLTPKAMEALEHPRDSDVTPRRQVERDGDNRPTGVVLGNGNTLGKIFDQLPKTDAGPAGRRPSKKFFRE